MVASLFEEGGPTLLQKSTGSSVSSSVECIDTIPSRSQSPTSATNDQDCTEDTTAVASSACSSPGPFEDLEAPLIPSSSSTRCSRLSARIKQHLSFSGGSTDGSPGKGTPHQKPTKGILRRRKVYCSKRGEPATSFGTESSTEEGSPERRVGSSPARICKKALGRVLNLGSDSGTRKLGKKEKKVPKSVSIEEPECSPEHALHRERTESLRKKRRGKKKPPLVFGGTFPIDEPVDLPRGAVARAAASSINPATYPVDAVCCTPPNLCEDHAKVFMSLGVKGPAEKEVNPKHEAKVSRPDTPSKRGTGWFRLWGGTDAKLHKS
ncbi:uncharacterized protein LOC135369091 [Ornithodoros turicata]|uniref:uncharacterized protein LOC135369091 n=1 Tax=Ornithodoros turicata TaxID=34597 RepID=UPI0031388930